MFARRRVSILAILIGTLLPACGGAPLAQLEASVPTLIRAQAAGVKAGGLGDLQRQLELVRKGTSTAQRRELLIEYRAKRARHLEPTSKIVAAVADASRALSADLAELGQDLAKNDAQADAEIARIAVEGEPVTLPARPIQPATPAAPPAPPPAAVPGAQPSSPPTVPPPPEQPPAAPTSASPVS